jgi:hypothetical protein
LSFHDFIAESFVYKLAIHKITAVSAEFPHDLAAAAGTFHEWAKGMETLLSGDMGKHFFADEVKELFKATLILAECGAVSPPTSRLWFMKLTLPLNLGVKPG